MIEVNSSKEGEAAYLGALTLPLVFSTSARQPANAIPANTRTDNITNTRTIESPCPQTGASEPQSGQMQGVCRADRPAGPLNVVSWGDGCG